MRNLAINEMNLISGGNLFEDAIDAVQSETTLEIMGALALGALGAISKGQGAQRIGYGINYAIAGWAATALVLIPGYNNGLLGAYIKGDLCTVISTLWPFERKNARRRLKH
ncbi:MAG: hypothetical protein U1E78_09140 [Gammaproteobacteria bacterium]